jgi:molecular chaperone GrpE
MEQNEQENMNQEENQTTSNEEQNATDPENTQETENKETAEPVNFEAKIAELNDKYLRLYSEFDNYRKRMIKEKADIIRSAGEDVFKAFIPTIDDFERAIKANETVSEAEPIKEGMRLIYNKLISTSKSKGLEQMSLMGQPFDADVMEAIAHIPAPSDDLKGKVVDDVEKGYKLGEKVIRFAKVVVGN